MVLEQLLDDDAVVGSVMAGLLGHTVLAKAERLAVYQRPGEPCFRCGRRIERIVVGQRSTHFCPRCQPEPVASVTA